MPDPFPLSTPRLSLRRMTVDDSGLFFDLDRNPAVTRYVNPPMATVEEYREKIANEFAPYADAVPVRGLFAAEERLSGEFMGWFLLRPGPAYRFASVVGWDDPAHTEIGYRLKQTYWGKGYATEGATALIDHVFADPAVSAVVACALVANVGSWRVMQKVGMSESGRCELPGFGPAVTYRLFRN